VRDTDLRGVIAASLTPVTEGLEIDADRLGAHSAGLLDQGCDFVSVFGTTGEGASFSSRQKIAALRAMAAGGAVTMDRLIPAVIGSTIDGAVRMLDATADLGCRAALVLPPYYYAAGEEGIAAFYEAVLEAAAAPNLPIILYHIPDRSRVPITPGLIRHLVDRHGARIVGVKDSTGDRDSSVMLARTFPDLAIFTGDDRVLPDLLAAGGAGLIGGLPNLFASDLAALCRSPEGEDAPRLIRLAKARIDAVDHEDGVAVMKGILARATDDPSWRRVMPPLLPSSNARLDEVEHALAAAGPGPGVAAA